MRIRSAYALVGAAIAVAAAAAWLRREPGTRASRETEVLRQRIGLSVREHGILVSEESVPVEVGARGEILELVMSGTRVSKGDLVLRLDHSKLEERLDEHEVNIQTSETERDVSQAEHGLVQTREKNSLSLLRKRLQVAELRLETARAGLTKGNRRLLETDVEIAAIDLRDATEELARQKRLLTKGFVSSAMVEPYERRAESARASLEERRVTIQLREKGTTAEQLVELEKDVERLRALVSRGTSAMKRQLEEVDHRIQVSKARIAKNAHHVQRLRSEVARSESRAEVDGVVAVRMYRDWRSGGQWTEYKPGREVYKNDFIADIINPGRMKVYLMVNEADVNRLATGMCARIRVPAYPEREFRGAVTELAGIGRDRFDVAPQGYEDSHSGVTMFNACVSIDGEGAEFRPGMSARVEVEVEPPRDALFVPRAAVRRRRGETSVLRKSVGGAAWTRIEGRLHGDRYFMVEKGLSEGDRVVLPDPEGES